MLESSKEIENLVPHQHNAEEAIPVQNKTKKTNKNPITLVTR